MFIYKLFETNTMKALKIKFSHSYDVILKIEDNVRKVYEKLIFEKNRESICCMRPKLT